MSTSTKIEWTQGDDGAAGATWNPVTGCSEVSEGCDHCYAKTFAERWRGVPGHPFEQGFDVRLWPDRLEKPLRWRKPRRIFVNSMSDLFHDEIPDAFIAAVFAVMALARQHTFQVLTKRPGRTRSLLNNGHWCMSVAVAMEALRPYSTDALEPPILPLPNVWLGVSVETQKWAQVRLPQLAATPAAVRFASCEPLLGPVDLRPWLGAGLDWVITGGESGPKARPMHPNWARALRDQCVAADVPFFFKQWGEHLPVPIVDDPAFSGGRAFDDPRVGRSAAAIKERAPEKTHFRGGITRAMSRVTRAASVSCSTETRSPCASARSALAATSTAAPGTSSRGLATRQVSAVADQVPSSGQYDLRAVSNIAREGFTDLTADTTS